MSAATKSRKKSKVAAAAKLTVEQIRDDIAARETKLGAMNGYEFEYEELQQKLAQLKSDLEIAEAREAQGPSSPLAFPKASEKDIEIKKIDISGNHREREHEAA